VTDVQESSLVTIPEKLCAERLCGELDVQMNMLGIAVVSMWCLGAIPNAIETSW